LFGGTDYRLKGKGNDFGEMIPAEDDGLEEEKVMPPIRPDIHLLMVGEPGLGKS
jgi:hypothetical protein